MEDSDNNIDNKLGVKGLVDTNRTLPQPSTKPRVTVDYWQANNGSIIYTQPSALKNGFNSSKQMTNGNNQETMQKESHKFNTSATATTNTNNKQFNNNITALYLNGGGNRLNGHSKGSQTTLMNHGPNNEQVKGAKSFSSDTLNNFHHDLDNQANQTNRQNNHYQLDGKQPQSNGKLPSRLTNSHSNFEDDLNQNNSTKWSNGTTASDLLF